MKMSREEILEAVKQIKESNKATRRAIAPIFESRLNPRQLAIFSAYTGLLYGEFSEMHKYIEEILDRPVFTHELASPAVAAQIKMLSEEDFMSMFTTGELSGPNLFLLQ